jgi:hypothetical protein
MRKSLGYRYKGRSIGVQVDAAQRAGRLERFAFKRERSKIIVSADIDGTVLEFGQVLQRVILRL